MQKTGEDMIDKLEKKFGRFAIRGLMKYIIILYLAGFIINMINPSLYTEWLMLDIDKLKSGQIWRLVTFIIQPTDMNNLFRVFLSLYVYFMFGTALEGMWGSFRFNLYYFSGILFNILAVVGIYIFTYCTSEYGLGISYPISLEYLNLTLFLAFAVTFPETRFGIMGGPGGISMFAIIYIIAIVVDVAQAFTSGGMQMGLTTLATSLVWLAIMCLGPKAKHLAIAYAVLIGVEIIRAFWYGGMSYYLMYSDGSRMLVGQYGVIITIAVVASMLNFLLFFISLKKKGYAPNNSLRKQFMKYAQMNRKTDESVKASNQHHGKVINIYRPETGSQPRHKCAVCGRTEKDDDSLEFRFCSKCNGSYEYCSDHLYTHTHVE